MATNNESLALRAKLEGLPQELYDEIYDLTFTAGATSFMYSHSRHPQTVIAASWLQKAEWSSSKYNSSRAVAFEVGTMRAV